jgi:cyclopropane fatty-acyl-phospholipid synthase-like methyltransferase
MVDAHELEWTDEHVLRFCAHYGNKVHTYFAETMGAEIVRRTLRAIPVHTVCADYGCDSGGLTAALLDAGVSVIAFDISPKSLEFVTDRFRGRQNFLGAFTPGDCEYSSLPKADIVFSIETIEHVTAPHVRSYFEAIRLLLSPTGFAVFTTQTMKTLRGRRCFALNREQFSIRCSMFVASTWTDFTIPTYKRVRAA